MEHLSHAFMGAIIGACVYRLYQIIKILNKGGL